MNIYKLGRGVSRYRDILQSVANTAQRQYVYQLDVTGVDDRYDPWYLLKPASLSEFYARLAANMENQVRRMQRVRNVTMKYHLVKRNTLILYVVAAASCRRLDYMPCTNLTSNSSYMTLKCMEYGAYPLYSLVGENVDELIGSRTDKLYSADYRNWMSYMGLQYGQLNEYVVAAASCRRLDYMPCIYRRVAVCTGQHQAIYSFTCFPDSLGGRVHHLITPHAAAPKL